MSTCRLTTAFYVKATNSARYGAFMVVFDKNINATTKATFGKWINLLAKRVREGHESGEPGHSHDTLRQNVAV